MSEPPPPVRVRYAPSPTGALHLGGARTALFNFLFARQHGGRFLLRIEDTDQQRYSAQSEKQLMEGLGWLGLRWDEGPDVGGPYAPYVQSQRLPLYRQAADELLGKAAAYRCFCTPERLQAMRAEQRARKQPERYDGRCATIPPAESERRAAAGERFVIRQRIPRTGTTTVHDLILKDVTFQNETLDDHVLLKSDGFPTYHLAFAVDDHAMQISHIIRGVDWLPSAPKHVLLFAAFGWELPVLAHLPLVLGKDRQRLAKRHGARDVLEYRDAGYLPEAVDNFIAFLGWSPGTEEEIFTLDELIQRFQLEKVQPSPAVANLERLDWLNGQFIRRLPPSELAARLAERMPAIPATRLEPLVPLIQERLRTLAEGPPMLEFLFQAPDRYDPATLVPKGRDAAATAAALWEAADFLRQASNWTAPALDTGLREVAARLSWTTKDFFMALRLAVTGRTVTPPLIESMVQLGQDETVARVERAGAGLTAGAQA